MLALWQICCVALQYYTNVDSITWIILYLADLTTLKVMLLNSLYLFHYIMEKILRSVFISCVLLDAYRNFFCIYLVYLSYLPSVLSHASAGLTFLREQTRGS